MELKMDQEEVEDFAFLESTFVKEATDLEENKKAREKCLPSVENSVTIKQEINVEEEENSFVFESILVKEEANLEENEKDREIFPFASVIVKEEAVEAEDMEDYHEEKEETEVNGLEVPSPSTIKQENDPESEENLFPFESVFVKEEREEEEGEEIYGYDDERKAENNNDVPEALSGAVVDVPTNVTGDVAQRMRARFRSILFRRVPSTATAAPSSSSSSIRNSVVSSSLVQTKNQPPRGGPFQCGECGMGFKNEQNMWMHEFACKENAAVSKAACLGTLMGRKTKIKTQRNKTNLTGSTTKSDTFITRGSDSGRQKETSTQRKRRLAKARQKYAQKRATEDEETRRARLEHRREIRNRETEEQRNARLERQRLRQFQARGREKPEQRAARLECVRRHTSQARAAETAEERASRLEADRLRHSLARAAGVVGKSQLLLERVGARVGDHRRNTLQESFD